MVALILGNGRSLLDMPEDLLEKHLSYGMNYCPFQPTNYICVDSTILIHRPMSVYGLAAEAKTAYLSYVHKDDTAPKKLYSLQNVEIVYPDRGSFCQEKYFTGFTSAYVALKLAYYEGFDEVHLWGVDHDKAWAHYRDNYPPGDPMDDFRFDVQLWHYTLAAEIYKEAGRRIVNFSYPSELDNLFERGR
jgi:hypothetical protein